MKRLTGVIFCLIGGILYSVNYLTIALIGSELETFDMNLFQTIQNVVGKRLIYLSILSVIVGFAYLIIEEFSDARRRDR